MDMNVLKDKFQVNDEMLDAIQSGGEAADNIDYDNLEVPSAEKILEMIKGMQGISDDQKNSLLRQVLSGENGAMGLDSLNQSSLGYQFVILFSLLLVITLIFVLFGYKLFKSLKDKERKREEKRKMKQMKKKK